MSQLQVDEIRCGHMGGGEASRESILDISEEHQVGQSGQSRMGRAGGVETRDLMGGVPCGPPCGP